MKMGAMETSILVGVDGSDGALGAAKWAAAMAARLGASLHLVHAMRGVDEALLNVAAPQQQDAGAYPRDLGHAVLNRTADAVHAAFPKVHVSRTLHHRSPAEVLVDMSRHARMVVLNCSDVSPIGALLVGSTTLKTIAHSECPVVAWRGGAQEPTGKPLVVGVDEGPASHAALVTAFGLADCLGVGLTVVHATSPRRPPGAVDIPVLIDWTALEDEARQRLLTVVAPLAERWPRVDVSYAVETGRASRALLHHVVDAQFVVVGTRARGNAASALLGSTGLSLLHHSPRPVISCPASYVWDEWLPTGDGSLSASAHVEGTRAGD
jgi:nucleotide-binding universal stress UspA family protein